MTLRQLLPFRREDPPLVVRYRRRVGGWLGVLFAPVFAGLVLAPDYLPQFVLGLPAPALVALYWIAAAIFIGILRARFWARVAGNSYCVCQNCGYLLHGLPDQCLCPECGRRHDRNECEGAYRQYEGDADGR